MTLRLGLKTERKYIVCHTLRSGKDFAKKQGWLPQECTFACTNAGAQNIRGHRIKFKNLYYAPGWYQGKYAHEMERELRYVVKQDQIKEKKEE